MAYQRQILIALSVALFLFSAICAKFTPDLLMEIDQFHLGFWNHQDATNQSGSLCLRPSRVPFSHYYIPNVIHFVLLADDDKQVELSYAEFLSIKAAVLRANATEVKVHTNGIDAENKWWQEIRDNVSTVAIGNEKVPGTDNLLLQELDIANQLQVLRLAIPMREGGVYLESTTYVLKPLTHFLSNARDIFLGHESGHGYGLGNAVIGALADESCRSCCPLIQELHEETLG